jgi:hypothetical protein
LKSKELEDVPKKQFVYQEEDDDEPDVFDLVPNCAYTIVCNKMNKMKMKKFFPDDQRRWVMENPDGKAFYMREEDVQEFLQMLKIPEDIVDDFYGSMPIFVRYETDAT